MQQENQGHKSAFWLQANFVPNNQMDNQMLKFSRQIHKREKLKVDP
jgi:hypothetical protein